MSANNNQVVAASLTQTKAVYDRLQGQIDTLVLTVRDFHNVITPSATSWADVQAIVRAGLADKAFPVGTKMYCNRGNDTLEWDVIGVDHDTPADPQFTHSLTLQLHYCFPTAMLFGAPEALCYCDNSLAAGTYYFLDDSTERQFTVPDGGINAGCLLTVNLSSGNIASISVIDTLHDYTISSTTMAVSPGSSGTALSESPSVSVNNDLLLVKNGSNNYNGSALKQWLNSNAAAGSVWTQNPNNKFDRPPNWHTGEGGTTKQAGFMNGMDSDFLAVLGNVNKSSDTTTEKFFLLSESEVGGISGGTPYSYYAGINGAAANIKRIKTLNDSNNNYPVKTWWLRTPMSSSTISVRYIKNTGAVDNVFARAPYYVVPACCII